MRQLSFVLAGVLLLAGGCPPENYDSLLPTTLEAIDRIRNDTDVSPDQQRHELAALGLSPEVINALLRDRVFANQYGGDLRTAYEKVIAENLTGLTPDEVQIYAEGAKAVDKTLDFDLDDTGAQAIVNFLRANELSSRAQLQAYLADPANEVPRSVPDDVLEPLFVEFDPAKVLERLP